MRCFKSRGFGEDQFIEELERARLNRQMTVSVCQTGVKPDEVPSAPPANLDPVDLEPRLRPRHPLTTRRNMRPEYPYYCKYCDNGQRHVPRECPRRPSPGACFDCLEMGHRQGHPRCPGRDNSNHQSTPNRPTQAQQ